MVNVDLRFDFKIDIMMATTQSHTAPTENICPGAVVTCKAMNFKLMCANHHMPHHPLIGIIDTFIGHRKNWIKTFGHVRRPRSFALSLFFFFCWQTKILLFSRDGVRNFTNPKRGIHKVTSYRPIADPNRNMAVNNPRLANQRSKWKQDILRGMHRIPVLTSLT